MPRLREASTCVGMYRTHDLRKESLISLTQIGFLIVLLLGHKRANDVYHITCRSGR